MTLQTRIYTDNVPCLNLTALHKRNFIKEGQVGQSTCSRNNVRLWGYSWRVSRTTVIVAYDKNGKSYRHELPLIKETVNLGGERVYLQCPKCSMKRKQLYFVGGIAGCRCCHKLHYKSQSESLSERKYRKLDKLLVHVHNFGYRFDGHIKHKGKHWNKYHQLDKQIKALQQSIFGDINKRFGFGEAERHFGPYEIH